MSTQVFAGFRPLAVWVVALLAGCATMPMPDGSRIDRLPPSASAVQAPELSAAEREQMARQNAQILAEQNAAIRRDEQLEALRRSHQHHHWDLHLGYGWPGHRWHWSGHHWIWRPRWSFGFGWHGWHH